MGAVLRRGGASLLARLQSAPLYRRIGRRGAPRVTVRAATAEDLVAVHAIRAPGTPYGAWPEDPSWTPLVAVRSGRLVGSVDLVRHPPHDAPYTGYWLSSLLVFRLTDRGLGVGEVLTRAVVDLSREEGAPAVHLLVHDGNRAALRLYEKCGFVQTAIPGIEEALETEARDQGRRRIAMVSALND